MKSISGDDLSVFIKNFEVFIKKIYFILEKYQKIDESLKLDYSQGKPALSKFLTTLNKVKRPNTKIFQVTKLDQNLICDDIIEELKNEYEDCVNEEEKLLTNKKILKYQDRFSDNKIDRYILDSLVLRNHNAHQGKGI